MSDEPISYYVEIRGDDAKMVASDICDLVGGHYNVRARVAAPLEVKLEVRDGWGAMMAYAHTWQPMQRLTLQTGPTRADLDGVGAVVQLGPAGWVREAACEGE